MTAQPQSEIAPLASEDSVANVANEDAKRLAEGLDISSQLSILDFGQDVAARTAAYADELLDSAKASNLDVVGKQLNEIVVAAKGFNVSNQTDSWSAKPVIGAVIRVFSNSKDRMTARFETVKTQVDKLVRDVDATAGMLQDRAGVFQSMYDGVREEHESLGDHIHAIEIKLTELDHTISELEANETEADAAEDAAVLSASRDALVKRADHLRVLQHSALQTLPMIRVMQGNNIALIDKFHTIQKLTLPAWKRTFLMAHTLSEQKSTVELADSIDDATNTFLRSNADLLHKNSVATAEANQRLIVDIDTLRHVHDKVLQTLDDVQRTHEEGNERREKLISELETLQLEMKQGGKSSAELLAVSWPDETD